MKFFFESKSKVEIRERNTLDFRPHLHEQIEMGYIEEGSAVLVLDEKSHSLNKGDFFLVFPNQIHSYEKSRNLKAKIVIFPYSLIPEYKNIFSSKIPQSPVIHETANAKRTMELMFEIMPDNINVLKGFLLSEFSLLIDEIELNDISKYNIPTIKNLLIYCSQHFNEGISLTDVANELHISKYYISHIFSEKLNTTFSDYMTRKRLEYACNLLCNEDLSIIEVAHQSGFNSIRSFNRNFLKHMSESPKEYRKAIHKAIN